MYQCITKIIIVLNINKLFILLYRTIPVNTTSTTLGRLSKSTGRLLVDDYNSSVSDRAQTLPRKLKTESKIKKQVNNNNNLFLIRAFVSVLVEKYFEIVINTA